MQGNPLNDASKVVERLKGMSAAASDAERLLKRLINENRDKNEQLELKNLQLKVKSW